MGLKELFEARTAKQEEMKAILDGAQTENRALSDEESTKFDTLENEIKELDKQISRIQTVRSLEKDAPAPEKAPEERSVEQREYDAFTAFLRGTETRQEEPMTKGDNGAVIPSSIANKIIEKVVDICPIFKDAERYNVKGTLNIPYYDATNGDITMDYADEFTDGESTTGKFGSISLTGYLARAITDVSKSLINNSQFDIANYVINHMALRISVFLEKELLFGTNNKIDGLKGVTQTVETLSSTAITPDELIDLQESIPDVYQGNAYFIMNKATRTAIRKLKDGQNNYLLNRDFNSRWGYTLLGKDVYTSAQMPTIAAGATAIYYGDYKGLAVKVSEDINIEVLRETKARQHAIEVLGFVELDAKVQNAEMISKLVMKA